MILRSCITPKARCTTLQIKISLVVFSRKRLPKAKAAHNSWIGSHEFLCGLKIDITGTLPDNKGNFKKTNLRDNLRRVTAFWDSLQVCPKQLSRTSSPSQKEYLNNNGNILINSTRSCWLTRRKRPTVLWIKHRRDHRHGTFLLGKVQMSPKLTLDEIGKVATMGHVKLPKLTLPTYDGDYIQ